MDELLVDFLTESAEHLEAIDGRWVRCWRDLQTAGIIDDLSLRLRAIIGTRGLLDLPRMQRIARAAQSLIDRPRRESTPDPATIDLVAAAVGRLRTILAVAALGRREPVGDDLELLARIERAAVAPAAVGVSAGPAPAERRAYLTVFALNEAFALPIAFARSGVRIDSLTRIPSAPPHLVGIANLDGAAVAVVCLARRLEPTARPSGRGMIAVVVSSGGRVFALAVQDFGDVVEAGDADIEPARAGWSRAALSSHVLRSGSMLAPILDPELVFDPRRAGGSHESQFSL